MKAYEILAVVLVVVCGIVAFWYLVQDSSSGMAISTSYHYNEGQKGIVYTTDPYTETPGIPAIQLLGTRFPAFVLLDSLGLYDIGKCRSDMMSKARIANPKTLFDCYNTPLGQYVKGEPVDPWGRTRFKGNLFCYKRWTGGEAQGIDTGAEVTDKLMKTLVESEEESWTSVRAINSEGVSKLIPVCA
ncbi:hypothetical protein KY329_01750 [Candidatus Woesearchaeota archaeon]|nr:hypothetical protein [Candidatus Woesearchaeota archaeon]